MEDVLEKAISVKIDVGESGSVPELRQLEALFFKDLQIEQFTEKFSRFAIDEIMPRAGVPTVEDLKKIDKFVREFFEGKLPTAELWVVRGFVIGKMLEQQERQPVKAAIDIAKLPATVRAAAKEYSLTVREVRALEYVNLNGAKHLTDASLDTIKTAQQVVFEGIKKRATIREIRESLEQAFMNDEAEVNRNWKRVAIHEVNSAFNQAYLAQQKPGEWVMGMSLPDRCDACGKLIDGKVYPIIPETKIRGYSGLSGKDREEQEFFWENAVWLGKNNIARSWSKRKRTTEEGETVLKDRKHDELYMPTIPLHIYCRCRWVKINPGLQYVKDGEMKMKVQDPAAWKKWYDRTIVPQAEKFGKYGIEIQTIGG